MGAGANSSKNGAKAKGIFALGVFKKKTEEKTPEQLIAEEEQRYAE